MPEIELLHDARAAIGESPVWSAEEQALYWVDILEPALYRRHMDSGVVRRWPMPSPIGSVGLREGGGAVVALRSGLHALDFDSCALELVAPNPEADNPATRLNDGKVGPDGRFWVGSMDDERHSRPLGALYRLGADHQCRRMLDGLVISNGLAWSADGNTLYHADTGAQTIHRYDYDPASGEIDNPRLLAAGDVTGRPDGGATDVEGYYWSAAVSGAAINRFAPDGRLERRIELPVPRPTCPCFGGPDLKTLFVTSLRAGLGEAELAQFPLSGGVLALEVDVPGVPVSVYRG